MRMLREAAVVAAVVGSLGMVGAGIASAGGPHTPTINCTQTNGDTTGDTDAPLLADLVPGGGDADARNLQNNCGVGIIGNDQSSGDANGGDATGAL